MSTPHTHNYEYAGGDCPRCAEGVDRCRECGDLAQCQCERDAFRSVLAARLQRIDPNGVWSDVACALEDMPTPTMEELTEAYERLTREGETI